jgi:hypothetical protein
MRILSKQKRTRSRQIVRIRVRSQKRLKKMIANLLKQYHGRLRKNIPGDYVLETILDTIERAKIRSTLLKLKQLS